MQSRYRVPYTPCSPRPGSPAGGWASNSFRSRGREKGGGGSRCTSELQQTDQATRAIELSRITTRTKWHRVASRSPILIECIMTDNLHTTMAGRTRSNKRNKTGRRDRPAGRSSIPGNRGKQRPDKRTIIRAGVMKMRTGASLTYMEAIAGCRKITGVSLSGDLLSRSSKNDEKAVL